MGNNAHLSRERFVDVIDATPLVSIDLIIRNAEGKVLLGYRENKPAQNFWFVPGGRIVKNELLADAFVRLLRLELGDHFSLSMLADEAEFLGVYQHLYDDNAFDAPNVSTHYVVLGYALTLSDTADLAVDLNDQHAQHAWWTEQDLLASEQVHPNTKAYFDSQFCQ